MSALQDLRTRRKHRGKTPFQLVQEVGRLERVLDERDCELVAKATTLAELEQQCNRLAGELDQTRIEAQRIAEQDARQIKELRRQVADLTRKVDIGVNAEHVIGKTQAMDADEIRAHCTQPKQLWQPPMAAVTNPGHLPRQTTRGLANDDTQPIPRSVTS